MAAPFAGHERIVSLVTAVVLALGVALSYGAADFVGGFSSRHNPVVAVMVVSQTTSLGLLAVALAVGGGEPRALDLLLGAASGAAAFVGIGLLYRGLASGTMGVIAPLTAVGAALVPTAAGLVGGERPAPVALLGVVAAVVAVVLVAGGGGGRPLAPRELALALGAGLGFGTAVACLAGTSSASGLWPVVASRAVAVAGAVAASLVVRQAPRLAPGSTRLVVGGGLLDAVTNLCYLLALRTGLASLVGPVAALYPVSTVVLARVVLGERLRRRQLAGVGLALAGVVLIAAA